MQRGITREPAHTTSEFYPPNARSHSHARVQQIVPPFLLAALSIPVLWPFYDLGLPRSFDGGLHLLRIAALERQIANGQWLPRWSPDLMLGYGYPLFSFYAPASYYLVVALHWLGFDIYSGFIAVFVLATVMAGLGTYQLCLALFDDRQSPALLAAVVYMYSPYLVTNIYIRGALAEAVAQALLPWIFWLAFRLITSDDRDRILPWFVLVLALVAVTHNITLLFLPPILIVFMFAVWIQNGAGWQIVKSVLVGLSLAMGVSAFFWLPVLAERSYLADTAYEIATSVWLPGSVWTSENFLDGGLTFEHTFDRPIRLGLVQLCLAAAGVVMARKTELWWICLVVLTLVVGSLMFAWSLPIWLSIDILAVAQFAWRLLSILSLLLAILSGGIAMASRQNTVAIPIAVVAASLAIYAGVPRLSWMDLFAHETVNLSAPVFAQTELEKSILLGGEGNSSIQEFRPKWAARSLLAERDSAELPGGESPIKIHPLQDDGMTFVAKITSESSAPLRLATFYYPAWRATIDGDDVQVYPSGELGLLTVDVPSGTHLLRVTWRSTTDVRVAGWISVFALAVLIAIAVRQRARWPVVISALLMLAIAVNVGLSSLDSLNENANEPIMSEPGQPVRLSGLQMVGYRTELSGDGYLYLYPYWHVQKRLNDNLVLRFELLDAGGSPIATVYSEHYHNTLPSSALPQGALFDDAFSMALPAHVPAGVYTLSVTASSSSLLSQDPIVFGELWLPDRKMKGPTYSEINARVADSIKLLGYAASGVTPIQDNSNLQGIITNQEFRQQLFWSASSYVGSNYHGFVHLVDHEGIPIVQEDQLPGPLFQPPRLWSENDIIQDSYLFRIPPDANSGLYYPMVGMYIFENLDRLPIWASGSAEPADHILLPPLKVVNPVSKSPQISTNIRFADIFELKGYDLESPPALTAGSTFTITLYYQSLAPTAMNLTRFVQLYEPDLGVVAQADSPPAGGHNPTWSWIPGEIIVDPVHVRVNQKTVPGDYQLYVGFYEGAEAGRRIPVFGGTTSLENDWAPLTSMVVD